MFRILKKCSLFLCSCRETFDRPSFFRIPVFFHMPVAGVSPGSEVGLAPAEARNASTPAGGGGRFPDLKSNMARQAVRSICCAFLFVLVACGGEELPTEPQTANPEQHSDYTEPPEASEASEPPEPEVETSPPVGQERSSRPYFEPDPSFIPTCDPDEVAGLGSKEVVDFLNAFAPDALVGSGGITDEPEITLAVEGERGYRGVFFRKWASSPRLGIASNMTENQRRIAREAVGRMNNHLPDSYRILLPASEVDPVSVDPSFEGVNSRVQLLTIDHVPSGFIYIEFRDPAPWLAPGEKESKYGLALTARRVSESEVLSAKPEISAAQVFVDPGRMRSDDHALTILIHELMHALGIRGHVNGYSTKSVMDRGGYSAPTSPGVLDCAILEAVCPGFSGYDLAARNPIQRSFEDALAGFPPSGGQCLSSPCRHRPSRSRL